MVNTQKTIKRERTRLRKSQNPQQPDFKKLRKAQKVRTKYWATKKRETVSEPKVVEDKKKPKKDKKKAKKPELEIVEDEPELEVIDEELEELYDIDDDDIEEDLEDEEITE